jgi:long-chain acyl-CoA synthetase
LLVHELFQQGSDEKIALYTKDAKYSYAQAKKKVMQYRNYLYAQGMRQNEHVAIFAKNSAEFLFSYLAVASLGGAVVPLTPC